MSQPHGWCNFGFAREAALRCRRHRMPCLVPLGAIPAEKPALAALSHAQQLEARGAIDAADALQARLEVADTPVEGAALSGGGG